MIICLLGLTDQGWNPYKSVWHAILFLYQLSLRYNGLLSQSSLCSSWECHVIDCWEQVLVVPPWSACLHRVMSSDYSDLKSVSLLRDIEVLWINCNIQCNLSGCPQDGLPLLPTQRTCLYVVVAQHKDWKLYIPDHGIFHYQNHMNAKMGCEHAKQMNTV